MDTLYASYFAEDSATKYRHILNLDALNTWLTVYKAGNQLWSV